MTYNENYKFERKADIACANILCVYHNTYAKRKCSVLSETEHTPFELCDDYKPEK
jgi:hypothetical protein